LTNAPTEESELSVFHSVMINNTIGRFKWTLRPTDTE
jgi:hypothetical protein